MKEQRVTAGETNFNFLSSNSHVELETMRQSGVCIIKRRVGRGKVEVFGATKDEELKLEEIKTSHTLGGAGEVARGEGRGEGVDV